MVLDSKQTIESVKFMAAFWKEAHDEGGLAWDDTNNNRAFLSGEICATLNGASIYVAALNGKDKFKTEKGAPLHTDILHAPLPKGPAGEWPYHTAFTHMVMKYSKNQKARQGLPALGPRQGELREVVRGAEGLRDRADARLGEAPDVEAGPGDAALQQGLADRPARWATPASRTRRRPRRGTSTSSPTCTRRSANGKMTAEDSVKWAAGELRKIYV